MRFLYSGIPPMYVQRNCLLVLLLFPLLIYTQSTFECYTDLADNSGGRMLQPLCWPDNIPPCEETIDYAPDPNALEETPLKYIKVVLHVFQNSSDPNVLFSPGNFTNSVEHLDVLRSWFHHPTKGINARLSNICDPLPKVVGFESPHIPDSRIRFLFDGIENKDIFFYDDPDLWGGGARYGSIRYFDFLQEAVTNNAIVQADPDILNSVHVFMPAVSTSSTQPVSYSEGGYTYMSNNCGTLARTRHIVLFGNFYRFKYNETGVSTWVNYLEPPSQDEIPFGGAGVLAEWFHMVGVDHPANSQSHLNMPAGVNDHCDDTPPTTTINNLMDGTFDASQGAKCGLTQCQLGRAHHFLDALTPQYIRSESNGFAFPSPWDECEVIDPDLEILNGEFIVWDEVKRLYSNVIIKPGGTLTINCDVYMPENGKITVETGGELFINAKITAGCNTWKGIEVLGNPNASQFTSGAQGKVRLDNAIVEDAEIAVSLFHRQTYEQGGGILLANNTTFLNCQNAVAMAKYDNTYPGGSTPIFNLSQIEKCTFTLNDDFNFAQGGEHIQLDRVTRVRISNSVLQDERTSYASAAALQDGIRSSNATFWLTGAAISNMRYGIKAENIKSGRTFRVNDNAFTDNFFGMSVRAVDNFEFTDNNISVGGFTGPTTEFTFPNRQTGLHVDQSSGFFIEENDFTAAATLPTGAEPVGLAVNNTNIGTAGELNTDFNDIFRNTFTGLYRANVANGLNNNPNPDADGGLRYFCNQNTTNLCTDFTVFDGSVAAVQQADNGNAAGNTFTQYDSCNPFSDFDNSNGNFITYHYFDQSPGGSEEPLFIDPASFNNVTAQTNLCTDNDGSTGPLPPGGDGTVVGQFPAVRQNYLNLRSQYTSLLDGGDTDFVLSAIASMGSGSFSIYQQLQQLSPWLSSEVLQAFTDHSTPSATEKVNLLSANPDGIKGTALNNSIANGGWFTSQQIANIQTAAQGTTTRTQLEENLRTTQAELQDITQALENYYQIDETDSGIDYANQATWAANSESLDGYLRSIDNRLWAADITSAQNEIATLQAMDMGTPQTQEVNYFVQLKTLEIDLLNSNRSYDDATPAEISDLQNIATQSTGRAGIQAQNWLHLLNGSEVQNEAYWGSLVAPLLGEEQVPTAPTSVESSQEYLRVHPNPSTGVFRFYYQPQANLAMSTLRIYNLSGQMVHQEVIPSGSYLNWQPTQPEAGFYFYLLEGPNETLLQQGKLVYMPE